MIPSFVRGAAVTAVAAAVITAPARAKPPQVVVSIKPIHSLVAGVMAGVGEPDLLIEGGGSPHSYALRPSEAQALQEADVVFWVGEALETFLAKPLAALPRDARVLALHEAEGVTLLPYRDDAAWAHHADAHGEAEHEGRHGEPHDATDHTEQHAEHHGEHHEEHHEEHGHGAMDMHIWLDPANAEAMVAAIVATLSRKDPAHAARYEANGRVLADRLAALDRGLQEALAPVRGRPYVVLHDAYHYLEHRYDLGAVAAISVSPERPPGAGKLTQIRDTIRETGVACVFAEPQFEPAVVRAVTEGTGARIGVLDPLGSGLEPGSDAYFALMRDLAQSLTACLEPVRRN